MFIPPDDGDYWTAPINEIDADDLGEFFARDREAYDRACVVLGFKRLGEP